MKFQKYHGVICIRASQTREKEKKRERKRRRVTGAGRRLCKRKVVVADWSSPVFKAPASTLQPSPPCLYFCFPIPGQGSRCYFLRPSLVVSGTMFALQNEHRHSSAENTPLGHMSQGTTWTLTGIIHGDGGEGRTTVVEGKRETWGFQKAGKCHPQAIYHLCANSNYNTVYSSAFMAYREES